MSEGAITDSAAEQPEVTGQPVIMTTRHERMAALTQLRTQRRGRCLGMSAREAITLGR